MFFPLFLLQEIKNQEQNGEMEWCHGMEYWNDSDLITIIRWS